MAFDGITTAAIVADLDRYLRDARIAKIRQTERDELQITCKTAEDLGRGRQVHLMMSAQAQMPLVYIGETGKQAPVEAPAFCMLLRKHLENGRITSVEQPSLERVVRVNVSHYDEMGDLRTRTLLIELMGKHSNIILTDENDVILDAIRHIPSSVSSVREVLPGRPYFLPDTQNKRDPFAVRDMDGFLDALGSDDADLHRLLYGRFKGISPLMAEELIYRAHADASARLSQTDETVRKALSDAFLDTMRTVRDRRFSPVIYYENKKALEYAALPLRIYEDRMADGSITREDCFDMSELLARFYAQKSVQSRMRNKSADLRHIVTNLLERTVRKYDLQREQMRDAEKRDRYRLRGELLTAYAHTIEPGAKEAKLIDYNTGKEVTVPLDETLSATENAQKCFDRYARMKRTYETLETLTKEVAEEITHLQSIRMALDLARSESDLQDIRRELIASNYLRGSGAERAKNGRKAKGSAKPAESKPLHYRTGGGFDVYVGKNNTQNDRLTFQKQGDKRGEDWWFHAKGMPGSHVVLKADGREIPDRDYEEAASLAAYYSAGRDGGKVEIDYMPLKNVKKPGGAKPGFVVYYSNYSMVADTDISSLTQVDD
ncbi:MAG: NFACT family protein [Lachnospiraceae bacterium]|nr:NFACT family protein [Lachnospiraceae bacterium]